MAGALTAAIAAAFSGGAAAATDPYFEYTTLLLPGNGTNGAQNNTFLDSSTNNFTITRNGHTTQGTFSPFSQTGWGNYLGTTSDRLTTATSNSAFSFGTGGASNVGDFTIEGFVNLNSIGSNMIFQMSTASTGYNPSISNSIALYVGDAANLGKIEIYVANSALASTNVLVTSADIGQWRHFAIVRTSGVTSVYWNGSIVAGLSAITDTTNYTMTYCVIGTVYNNTYGLKGYLSNFRVVKGTSLYSGSTITIPTSTLTAVTNTSFLIANSNRFRDISSNAIGLNTSGSPSVQAFSPFNPSASWSAATYGGSGYFDGSGDYLTAGAASNWTFLHNGSDWTAQFWVYHDATSSYSIISTTAFSAQIGMSIILNNSGANTVQVYITRGVSGSDANFVSSAALVVNQWNYVAVTFTSSTKTCAFTINGASAGSSSNTGFAYSSSDPTNTLAIGRYQGSSPSAYLNGYISSLRISNTIRTGLTTLPTTPYTSDANTNLLLNFTNAGIYDATSKNDLETVGNAQISTAQSKWGGSSMYFDGTGDYVTSYNANALFRIGNIYTIELWFYTTTIAAGAAGLICLATGASTNSGINIYRSGSEIICNDGTTGGTGPSSGSSAITANTWAHLAVVSDGSTTKMYIDGVLKGTYSGTTASSAALTYVTVGANGDKSSVLNGYIQDARITKGIARYTTNFTPPTAALPTL